MGQMRRRSRHKVPPGGGRGAALLARRPLRVGGRRAARAQLRLAGDVHRHHAQPGAAQRRRHRRHPARARQLRECRALHTTRTLHYTHTTLHAQLRLAQQLNILYL